MAQENRRTIPFRKVAPNLITVLAMCAGMTAIRFAIEGQFNLAIYAILAAAILDALDGRIARLLRTTSKFGAELDSLGDFLSFGVAPAVILYLWALDDLPEFGWLCALVYATSIALRLARFNVALDETGKPEWHKDFFVGVPAPAAALLVVMPICSSLSDIPPFPLANEMLLLVYILFVAGLVISRFPTFSAKRWGRYIRRDMLSYVLVFAVPAAWAIITFTMESLLLGALLYFVSLPIAYRLYRKRLSLDAIKE